MAGFDLNYSGKMDDDATYVAWLMLLFSQARNRRVNFEIMWEETAALCWPEYRNSWAFGHVRAPGQKYAEYQVDTSGSIASHRFMSICDVMITPYNMLWSYIKADDDYLMRQPGVKAYYQAINEILWKERYRSESGFFSNNQTNWQNLGVFGNMGMLIDELEQKPGKFKPGIRYMATSPGEMYVLRNYQGRIEGYIRHFRWTARQAFEKWGMAIPVILRAAMEKNDMILWDFLQFVLPNTEYDPLKIFDQVKGKPYSSTYVSVAGYCILERGGYRSFPWAGSTYMLAPEEDYGRGPGQMVLPDLKTLNAEKSLYLEQMHKAVKPAYLINDDGLNTLRTTPNAKNYGGLGADGQPLARPLETGKIELTPEAMQMSLQAVNDAFLVSLYSMFGDEKTMQMNPRQVIEYANQRGIFLSPLGRQFGEYIGPMIEREIDVLNFQGKFRGIPRPQVLREAKGEFQTVYCSPLAQSVQGQPIAGYMRLIEFAGDAAQKMGDPSVMDVFDLDAALPDMGEADHVPVHWFADPKRLMAKRQNRQQSQEREAQVKELPGKAAIIKAQAISDKAQAGQNTGGTLTGMPAGGMPMMPGQNEPGGRAFGQPGPQGP